MADRPTEEKQFPREIQPEPTPVFVRSHTCVKGEKPRKNSEGKLRGSKLDEASEIPRCRLI